MNFEFKIAQNLATHYKLQGGRRSYVCQLKITCCDANQSIVCSFNLSITINLNSISFIGSNSNFTIIVIRIIHLHVYLRKKNNT